MDPIHHFHAHIIGALTVGGGSLRSVDSVGTPPTPRGESAREEGHQRIAQTMFCFIGMQFWCVFRESAADDPCAFFVVPWNGMNGQSDIFASHGMAVEFWEGPSNEVHAEWAALHEPRGAAQHHPERFIACTGGQNQVFGEDPFGSGQDLKSTGHTSHFDQSVVTAWLVLLAEMVQDNPRINDGFLEVMHLVFTKAIGWVYHFGAEGRAGINITPHQKI